LAEGEESFVGLEGDLVVAVQSWAVVDSAVGGFDDPAASMDDEAASGFGPDATTTVTPALAVASATVWPV
jgi:hypothetical protein